MNRWKWEKKNLPKLPKKYREPPLIDPQKAHEQELRRQVRETIEADEKLRR